MGPNTVVRILPRPERRRECGDGRLDVGDLVELLGVRPVRPLDRPVQLRAAGQHSTVRQSSPRARPPAKRVDLGGPPRFFHRVADANLSRRDNAVADVLTTAARDPDLPMNRRRGELTPRPLVQPIW